MKKKLLSMALAVSMIFSSAGSVCAADFQDGDTTVVFTEEEPADTEDLPVETQPETADQDAEVTVQNKENSSETVTEIQENNLEEADFSDSEEVGSFEGEDVEWGGWGSNLNWFYDKKTEKLRITGKGAMQKGSKYPWDSYTIKSLEIGEGVTTINVNAFASQKELEELSFSSTVTTLGSGAFQNCTGLKSVTLPEGMKTIGLGVFQSCTNLQTISIPDSVTTIESNAFSGCSSLENVTISSNTNIANGSFIGSTNIKNIVFTGTGTAVVSFTYWNGIKPVSIEAKEGVHTLKIDKGISTENLETLTLPDNLPYFEGDFKNNTILSELDFKNTINVTSQFENCTNLSDVNFKNAIKLSAGFENCTGLKSIKLNTDYSTGSTSLNPNYKSEYINVSTLSGCTSLENITFCGTGTIKECIPLKDLTHDINIVIEDGVTAIGGYAFEDCTARMTVEIPASIKSIARGAFIGSTNITDIYYGGTRKSWGAIAPDFSCHPKIHFINEKLLSDCTMSLDPDSYEYTGEAICPLPVIKSDDTVLVEGTDYTLSYSNNIEVGTATVTATGCGDYSDEISADFQIVAANDISLARDYSRENETYEYTGQEITPNVILSFPVKGNPDGKLLSRNKDFTVSYENNVKVGKARIIIKGIGDYTGEKRMEFRIIPNKVQNMDLSSKKRMILHVQWDKLNVDAADYYEIQYCLKDKENDRKTVKVSRSAENAAENIEELDIEKLEPDKVYQVRMRGCKNVDGVLYEGQWCDEKVQKVKGNMTIEDCWSFANFGTEIPGSILRKIWGDTETVRNRLDGQDSVESGGLCYGLSTVAFASYYYDLPGLDMVKKETLSQVTKEELLANKTLMQMIMFAHILQEDSNICIQRLLSTNQLAKLVQAVQDYDDHTGEPVVIDLKARSGLSTLVGSHTVSALGIDEEMSNDTQTVIQIFDTRYPGSVRHLYLYKSNGEYASWKYEEYSGQSYDGNTEIKKADLLQFTTIATGYFVRLYQSDMMAVTGDQLLSVECDWTVPSSESFQAFWSENRPDDFTEIESTNGENYSDEKKRIEGWVKGNNSDSFSDVPAGTTIWLSSSYHSIKIKAEKEADITLKVTDTTDKSVQVSSSEAAAFTVTVYDRDKSSGTVEKTEMKGITKAAISTSVVQTGTELKISGSGTIGMKKETGTEDDSWNMTDPEIIELPETSLEEGKTYTPARKDGEMQLEEMCKHQWSAWKVTAAPQVGKKGSKERTCSLCGTKEKSEIPALSKTVSDKVKITNVWWSIGDKNTISADVSWAAFSKAKKYAICYGYVNTPEHSQKEISSSETRRLTVRESLKSTTTSRFWVEAYDSTGNLIARSDEKYFTDADISFNSRLTYNGKAQVPGVKVRVQNRTLKKGTDYTVTASNNTYPGKGQLKIKLKGNYAGTITESLTISLRSTSFTSLKGGKRYFTAKWKKASPGVTEYQIQYSTAKNFKKSKTVRVKNARTVQKKVTGVKKGRYYVRIRTAGKIKGKTYYSGWSSAKKVTIK